MSETANENAAGYGYAEQEVRDSSFKFGLNTGVHLTKFEWTPNGGKDGAEQEALDIVFNIGGKEVSYRKFPISKAYVRVEGSSEQIEVTDPNHPAIKQEKSNLSALLVHILGCFVPKEDIKTALQSPISSFKDYCKVLQGLLPNNFATKPLDIFFGWQWKITGESDKTYLELPKNMKQGRWLSASIAPKGGEWEEQKKPNPSDNEVALRYVDKEGNIHPFTRTGWYLNSNFGSQQKEAQTTAGSNISTGSGSGAGGW